MATQSKRDLFGEIEKSDAKFTPLAPTQASDEEAEQLARSVFMYILMGAVAFVAACLILPNL